MGFIQTKTVYDAGNVPIWLSIDRTKIAGGILSALPSNTPCIIPCGTPAYLDKMSGGTVSILETFKVAADVASGDTAVVVYAAGNVPQITAGLIVMKAPETYTTTGKAGVVGTVSAVSGSTNLSFAISANALGALTAGDILVVASASGATATMAVLPNGLIWHDLRVRTGDTAQPAALVVSGQILEDRIAPIPTCVKDNLPMITFEKEV